MIARNALTIDLEDWYQTHDFDFPPGTWGDYEDRVERGAYALIELLSRKGIKATFFILGYVAGKHPSLIRDIAAEGHEIGSHGMLHKKIFNMEPGSFREDLLGSKKRIEDIIGKSVTMFRAPSWTISENCLWALEILEAEGFTCDSSIQPFKTPLSGMTGVPLMPFRPVVGGRPLNIVEFPPVVLKKCGITIPFAGGFYFRFFPARLVKKGFEMVNRERPGMLYLHPWEVDPGQPKLSAPLHISMIHYLNLQRTVDKLDYLTDRIEFFPLGEVIRSCTFPEHELKGKTLERNYSCTMQ